ncbi:ComF family protein [Candidatus Woesebacteria bacterium]|nr:ComF family protein [Candidatus Woesebacteria bacterium]
MLFQTILAFLFPPVCAGCRRIGEAICTTCISCLQPTVSDICPYCYKPSEWGRTHDHCKERGGLDGAISCVRYNQTARSVVKSIKYSFVTEVFASLEKKIPPHWWRIEAFTSVIGTECILQPVPLHSRRKNKRGFNQAELIAQSLAKRFNLRVIDSLERIKNTEAQARQESREARRINIQNAFNVTKPDLITQRTIILVDDIFTSGSTAKEAARVLKSAGAHEVYLYSFAHGT